MIARKLFVIILLGSIVISCNSNSSKIDSDNETVYVAKIDTSMTLTQIAKANNIGEPYLRSKLGIRENIGNNYNIVTMAQRFNFTLDDLRKIIEDQKNKQASRKRTNKSNTDK
jgi:hypothetical protein